MKYTVLSVFTFLSVASVATADEAVSSTLPWWDSSFWKGEVEAGLDIENGNTHRRELNAGLDLDWEREQYEVLLKSSAKTITESGVRTEEEYRLAGEGRYSVSENTFVFADAEYVNDPFSGYNYRVTETVGVGHKLLTEEDMKWDVTAGIGARHSEKSDVTAEQETEFVFKPSTTFSWNINENLSFSEELSSTVGEQNVVSQSITSLKNKVAKNLYFKVSYDVEHQTDVAPGVKQFDSTTSFNLVYQF